MTNQTLYTVRQNLAIYNKFLKTVNEML